MVGRELNERYPKRKSTPGEILLSVEMLSGAHSRLKNASFVLKKGEILGLGGLDGSGRSELLETIFGYRERSSGKIELLGNEAHNRNPREAISAGFALLTEERRKNGIFSILSILENTTVTTAKNFRSGPIISNKKMRHATKQKISELGIKTPDEKSKIRDLSGGNQQKVILGRWLLTAPQVLLLDEPTRGIDVLAKYEIYKLIDELAASGRGIIIASSEMAELIGICDRILVMSGGMIAGELEKGEFSQDKIMTLAAKYV